MPSCIPGPARSDSATLTNGLGTVETSIDPQLVNTATGVRALFIVDDGRFYDTLNLSRRVRIDSPWLNISQRK